MRKIVLDRGVVRIAVAVLTVLAVGCGSSGSSDSPDRPTVVVDVDSQLADVGQRYRLDASMSVDPEQDGLEFFWTLFPPSNSNATFEDHCEDVPDEICTSNFDACSTNSSVLCNVNADCPDDGECVEDLAGSSPDCSEGRCGVGGGRQLPFATFESDVPGPYSVRVLVESSRANDTETVELDTYPSLYLLGSLLAFGGTAGGLWAEFPEAETFAPNAVALVASPTTSNLLIAVPGPPGRIREFDYRDGSDLGQFGETGSFIVSPAAMAFDADERLFVADADGIVRIFDGAGGRFIGLVGDVATGEEQVVAIAISPETGELLVVDGRDAEGVRRYNPETGNFVGLLGEIATAAGRAIDLAFHGDPATDLFVADALGALIRCEVDGTGCTTVSAASVLLAPSGPTSIAVNPASADTDADILVADAVSQAVIACTSDGSACDVFGQTDVLASNYADIAFAPLLVPEVAPPPMLTTTTSTTVP